MIKSHSLRLKLLVVGVSLSVLPLLVVVTATVFQNQKFTEAAGKGLTELTMTDLDHVVEGIYTMITAQQEVLQQSVDHSLNVARKVLEDSGGAALYTDSSVEWTAINQFTQASQTLMLPKMLAGSTWLGQNSAIDQRTPVVDEVKQLVGGTCTIFQRMNAQGDMLRVATNVETLDQTRAIGTYIPALNPDGQPNPVITALLKGQTFRGRAFVVNAWYLTAYEPIYNAAQEIVGALYFGIKQESAQALRQAIMDIKIGKTGYVYVLDSNGHYVISKDGQRDGEKIWEAKDADGNYFIQEMIRKAHAARPAEKFSQVYPWQNPGENTPRRKIARLVYYEPWDWVIGAGAYEDEFYHAQQTIREEGHKGLVMTLLMTVGTMLAAAGIWWRVSGGVSKILNRFAEQMSNISQSVSTASNQVAVSSQSLAEGSSSQASSLEETSSSLEQMSSMTRQNADNAGEADQLMKAANQVVENANRSMNELNGSMQAISSSSEETSKIIKTIDEIAFQTNLLALNAAVEAARAGEAGAGFAVVADEVRNLALRAAEAAKNTANLIEGTVQKINHGAELVGTTSQAFGEVSASAAKVGELVSEIAAASAEQAQGIEQINSAVASMDKLTQRSATNAEASAEASEKMNGQVEQMKAIVGDLATLVKGRRRSGRLKPPSEHDCKASEPSIFSRPVPPANKTSHPIEVNPDQVIPFDDEDQLFKDF